MWKIERNCLHLCVCLEWRNERKKISYEKVWEGGKRDYLAVYTIHNVQLLSAQRAAVHARIQTLSKVNAFLLDTERWKKKLAKARIITDIKGAIRTRTASSWIKCTQTVICIILSWKWHDIFVLTNIFSCLVLVSIDMGISSLANFTNRRWEPSWKIAQWFFTNGNFHGTNTLFLNLLSVLGLFSFRQEYIFLLRKFHIIQVRSVFYGCGLRSTHAVCGCPIQHTHRYTMSFYASGSSCEWVESKW